MNELNVLVRAEGLVKEYPLRSSSLLPSRRKAVHAASDVSFSLYKGETLGLVGESGCGKSTVGRMLVGIETPTAGKVFYQGQDLSLLRGRELARIRTQLQMVFQDPYSSLNPRKRVYDILSEPMLYHGIVSRDGAAARVNELLDMVGLPRNAKQRYPHEFSGGQRQRITIARALSLRPSVIVCDEPVSALDMSIQAQILNLLRSLQKDLGITYLFIAHGLGAVHYVSDRTAVMYLGRIVEIGSAADIFHHPEHPYSRMLLSAVPSADPLKRGREMITPRGEVPSAIDLPAGCRFHDRCPYAKDICRKQEPLLNADERAEHRCACWKVLAEQEGRNWDWEVH